MAAWHTAPSDRRAQRLRFRPKVAAPAVDHADLSRRRVSEISSPGPEHALDHVVAIMFENRSFDNLLGRLYQPGEVASFEGVIGNDFSNPIPDWAADGRRTAVPYGVAPDMNTPTPDPGEEYQHVNTQLFGLLDRREPRGLPAGGVVQRAARTGRRPTMDGFVTDFISMFMVELGRQPTVDEYAQIMTGYTPEQMPVCSAIARGFATFDHWFCDVPTCTYPNRSFFHAGDSSGYVVNMTPPGCFPKHEQRRDALRSPRRGRADAGTSTATRRRTTR